MEFNTKLRLFYQNTFSVPFELHIKSIYLPWRQHIKQQTQRGSIWCIRWALNNNPDGNLKLYFQERISLQETSSSPLNSSVKISKKNNVSDTGTRGLEKHLWDWWWWFLSHHAIAAAVTKTHTHPFTMAMMGLSSILPKWECLFMVRLYGVDILSHLPHQLTAAWTLL